MIPCTDALISLEARFADLILKGEKVVELRRRPMRLEVGTTVWMYVKVPVGEVVGSVNVVSMNTLRPETLWRKHGGVSGLNRTEFFDYFSGVERGFALVLENPVRLKKPVSLEKLRSLKEGFQPPQFFQRLANDGALAAAFNCNGRDHADAV